MINSALDQPRDLCQTSANSVEYKAVKELLREIQRKLPVILDRVVPDRFRLKLKDRLGFVRRMDYRPYDIYLTIDTLTEYEIRLHSCAKEPETVAWIEEFLKEGYTLYDVGANVGAYSLVASKASQGKSIILAFEPAFSTFANLCRNVLLNGCSGSIIPLNLALSGETRLDTFNYLGMSAGSSCHSYGKNLLFTGETFDPTFKQTTISYTIDDFIRTFSLNVPNLIKIDVDGIELEILEGAHHTLKDPNVKSVLVEVYEGNPDAMNKIIDLLTNAGLKLRSRHSTIGCGDESESEDSPFRKNFNYIFVRSF
jgi:FkbM family methyltransferase